MLEAGGFAAEDRCSSYPRAVKTWLGTRTVHQETGSTVKSTLSSVGDAIEGFDKDCLRVFHGSQAEVGCVFVCGVLRF